MTTEEKAKAYDEAVCKMKEIITMDNTLTIPREIGEYLFPELKESSEGKKIKKQIISFLKEFERDHYRNLDFSSWIAWLEKQSTPQVRTGLEWLNTIDDACDKRYAEEYAHGEYCHEQSFKWGFQEGVDWLEKQGEPTDINPSEFDLRLNKLLKQFETLPKEELVSSLSFYLNVVQNDGTYKADEKQGAQEPANKVESKFHEGDWVVDNAGYIWKIKGILNKFYILEGVEGGESRPTTEWADDTFHLWTIDDAKDGDVLACGDKVTDCPFIFHNLTKELNPRSYCGVTMLQHFQDNDENGGFWCHSNEVKPATKEQHEFLFQKMKEAGYKWDAESKELKEIEQKPAEWSEEDENMIRYIGNAITCEESAKYLEEKGVDMIKAHRWLESIRPQPKQEWSEEDSYMLESIVSDFAAGHKSSIGQDKWLKSLKPQNHWKPTKDQMEALHDMNLTGNISYAGQGQILIELYNDLKKLKE